MNCDICNQVLYRRSVRYCAALLMTARTSPPSATSAPVSKPCDLCAAIPKLQPSAETTVWREEQRKA